ncbi:MAG: hypothetical protein IPM54_39770 [Polyangiaceae bacterium]|nr:hypothetical protein [Polyangiaceae bacterium]
MPKIENNDPKYLDPCNAAAWVVFSVALEELGLAHIINAEGEKIQKVVGDVTKPLDATEFNWLVSVNESVRGTLETIICKEIVLNLKLCQALHFLDDHYTAQSQQPPAYP